ncbi:hypothetical protein ElyMa_004544800 [Elysia marginata]|uniref:Uncharacterized protein n=1 Tax=Elysia marginata TaxID=1093978 RepID=A0AAV4HPL5_9GAST|nr:hypothetical protein ElyMa_004544800 [Elysia marginata]
MNKTVESFDAMDDNRRSHLICFLVSEAKEGKVKKFTQNQELFQDIANRRAEVSKQRFNSNLSAMSRHVKKAVEAGDTPLLSNSCSQALKDRLLRFINASHCG